MYYILQQHEWRHICSVIYVNSEQIYSQRSEQIFMRRGGRDMHGPLKNSLSLSNDLDQELFYLFP